MATSPAFAATVLNGSIAVSATADNVYAAPANSVLVVTGGTSGSKIDEIRFQGTGTTVAGNITVWLYDGTTYHLVDVVNVPALTPSTTLSPWQLVKAYPNLTLLSNTWSLKVSSTVASQQVTVSAFGGSF